MEMRLDLKLKQRIQESDKEWILAHIENDTKDGKYVGRKEIVNYNPKYFSEMTPDQRDREVIEFLTEIKGAFRFEPCESLKYENGDSMNFYCQRYTKCSIIKKDGKEEKQEERKYLGNPPRKVANCKNKKDYFSTVNACHKVAEN